MIKYQNGSWIRCFSPKQEGALRLFCFPYAGAGSGVFRDWPQAGLGDIEVCAVELPGHGLRLGETPIREIGVLIKVLMDVLPLDRPFALFGHSLGALISFELARELQQQGRPLPVHLFVSGSGCPSVPRREKKRHLLPDDQFVQELRFLGGTPPDVLRDPEVLKIFAPMLRADFALLETYQYRAMKPLACPITAFSGTKDWEVRLQDLLQWKGETSQEFVHQAFAGDHFFINSARSAVVGVVNRTLRKAVPAWPAAEPTVPV